MHDDAAAPLAEDPDYLAFVDRLRRRSLAGEVVLAPDGLWLAVTQNCNLRCIGCWREGLFKKTYVTLDEVRQMLADSGGAGFRYVSLTWGEAFLHPELCDIIELCRAAHPRAVIDLTTNATIPPKGRFAQAISMIDDMGISIDGARKETFESIRLGSNFERFLDNVREVVAIRARTGNPARLMFCFTALTRNIAELPDVVRLAAELGVPGVYAQPMEMEHPEVVARTGQYHLSLMPKEDLWAIADKALAVGRALGVQVDLAGYLIRPPQEAAPPPPVAVAEADIRHCQYPYQKPFQYVRAGDRTRVQLCCYMVETASDLAAERYGMEFASPPPVVEFYNSPAYWQFRMDLARGRSKDFCGRCMQARTFPWKGPS